VTEKKDASHFSCIQADNLSLLTSLDSVLSYKNFIKLRMKKYGVTIGLITEIQSAADLDLLEIKGVF